MAPVLNTWSSVRATLWAVIAGVVLLENVSACLKGIEVLQLHGIFSVPLCCLLEDQVVSPQLLLLSLCLWFAYLGY